MRKQKNPFKKQLPTGEQAQDPLNAEDTHKARRSIAYRMLCNNIIHYINNTRI